MSVTTLLGLKYVGIVFVFSDAVMALYCVHVRVRVNWNACLPDVIIDGPGLTGIEPCSDSLAAFGERQSCVSSMTN